jgi:hypothetical protein
VTKLSFQGKYLMAVILSIMVRLKYQFTSDTIRDGLAVLIDENSGSRFRLVRFAKDVDVLLWSSLPTMLNSAIQKTLKIIFLKTLLRK